jgi:hypothetical protein
MTNPKPVPYLDREKAEADEFRERLAQRAKGDYTPPPLRRLKKPRGKLEHHLVIGDSHSHPDMPNHRWEWLGRMVADRGPDVVVDIGDSADMVSLFGVRGGSKKPCWEGRAYWRDVDSYLDGRDRFHANLGGYTPTLHKTLGNHEDRVNQLLDEEPRLRAFVDLRDLQDEQKGWTVHPFGEPVEIGGLLYCHYFQGPGTDKPISGVMPERALIQKLPGSFVRVCGHSHRFGFYEQAEGGPGLHGRKVTSVVCGMYSPLDNPAFKYARTSPNGWRAGILELWVSDGQLIDWRWTSLETIHRLYG